jgi:hypothetical protein
MPESRKRKGHPYRKPSDIPPDQRTKGTVTWALLFAVFGLLIAFFAAGTNLIALPLGTLGGGVLGYVIGKKMEKEA